jgi:hypothetical protein
VRFDIIVWNIFRSGEYLTEYNERHCTYHWRAIVCGVVLSSREIQEYTQCDICGVGYLYRNTFVRISNTWAWRPLNYAKLRKLIWKTCVIHWNKPYLHTQHQVKLRLSESLWQYLINYTHTIPGTVRCLKYIWYKPTGHFWRWFFSGLIVTGCHYTDRFGIKLLFLYLWREWSSCLEVH